MCFKVLKNDALPQFFIKIGIKVKTKMINMDKFSLLGSVLIINFCKKSCNHLSSHQRRMYIIDGIWRCPENFIFKIERIRYLHSPISNDVCWHRDTDIYAHIMLF